MSHNGLGKTASIDAEDCNLLSYMFVCRNADLRIMTVDRDFGEIFFKTDFLYTFRLWFIIQAELVIALVLHKDKATCSHGLDVLVVHQPLTRFRIKSHILEAFVLQQLADCGDDRSLHPFP